MHDVVIRGAKVVDGTGGAAFTGDVAVDGDRIAAVGEVARPGRREIDADGLLLTPGFVDIHTHYDGQVAWDPYLSPSSWHGVTTVVMGNCGVGFAPVRPDHHEFLIGVMEGVEDIPGSALAEGIDFAWESFPQYLDAIAARPHAIDVGAQVPHSALRVYVMGERGADHTEPATEAEIAEMRRLVAEGLRAGALGFTTSRTINHRAKDGTQIPTLTAAPAELWGIAAALAEVGHGHLEIVSDFEDIHREFEIFRGMAGQGKAPLSVLIAQQDQRPQLWREVVEEIAAARRAGAHITGQVAIRPIGLLLGLQSSMHPFITCPTYRREVAPLDLAGKVAKLAEPEIRRQIIAEHATRTRGMSGTVAQSFHKLFALGDPPDYEPSADQSVKARAAALGVPAVELAYDLLLQRGGKELLYFPLANYSGGDCEDLREMNLSDCTVPGLSDGGAHCGVICDGSMPTFMLTHWARDRRRGEGLPLEYLVRRQCRDTSRLLGLADRGTVEVGKKADLNLIEFDRLTLHPPEMAYDLPAGGRRLVQRADGWRATMVSGQVIFEHGEPTGALPGAVIRGPQPA